MPTTTAWRRPRRAHIPSQRKLLQLSFVSTKSVACLLTAGVHLHTDDQSRSAPMDPMIRLFLLFSLAGTTVTFSCFLYVTVRLQLQLQAAAFSSAAAACGQSLGCRTTVFIPNEPSFHFSRRVVLFALWLCAVHPFACVLFQRPKAQVASGAFPPTSVPSGGRPWTSAASMGSRSQPVEFLSYQRKWCGSLRRRIGNPWT